MTKYILFTQNLHTSRLVFRDVATSTVLEE